MEMKKKQKMGVGGDDYTGESTWPKGLRNPAATPEPAVKGSPKMGPIGESIKDVAGRFVRGTQVVGKAMGKVIPAVGRAAAVALQGERARRQLMALKKKSK